MANKRLLKAPVGSPDDPAWFDFALGESLLYVDGQVYMVDANGLEYVRDGDRMVRVNAPLVESPNGTTIPSGGTQIIDANLDVWSLNTSTNVVFRNGTSMGVTASSLTITNHVIIRAGLDSHHYSWNGTAWVDQGAFGLVESSEGTAVPPATRIVDSALAIWTLQSTTVIRNGLSMSVTASVIRIVGHVIKRDGLDGHRYSWNGTSWVDEGSIIPVVLGSANGTRGQTVVDRFGDTWVINLSNNVVFKNGVGTSAWASCLLMANDVLTHKGTGLRWWLKETGRGTDAYIAWNSPLDGHADPYTGAGWATRSPNGTRGNSVVFPDGQTWTRGASTSEGFEALREGLRFQNSSAIEYQVYNDRLYWVDSTGNWWQYGGLQDGSGAMNGLVFFGAVDPSKPPTPPPTGPLRYIVTTGSIPLGSYRLTVPAAAYASFVAGDNVIVEITNAMSRGAGRGPGGSHPQTSFANAASLPNPATQTPATRFWTENDSHIYECSNDGGGNYWRDLITNNTINQFLDSIVIARSINARIRTKAAGNELWLEDFSGNLISSQRAMTNANVYLNVIPILTDTINALPGGTDGYEIPAGSYPGAGILWINRPNFILVGTGMNSTELFSPKGVVPVGVSAMPGINGGQFKDFKLNSNNYRNSNNDPDWYGLNYSDGASTLPWPTFGTFIGINDYSNYDTRRTSTIPAGMSGYQSRDVLVERVWVNNYFNQMFGTSFCNNWVTKNSKGTIDCKSNGYDGWGCGHYDSDNCGMEDCELTSVYSAAGTEQFKSSNGFFRRLQITNFNMSLNNAGLCLLEDCTQILTADSCFPYSYHSPFQPCVNANANIGGNLAALGNTIRRHTIRQLGYVRGGCVTKVGINVQDNVQNVRIEGAYHSAPDYNAAVESFPIDSDGSQGRYPSGSRGLEANGQNLAIGGFAVDGLSPQHYNQGAFNQANLYALRGHAMSGFGNNRGDPRTLAKWGAESVYFFG